MRKAIYNWNPIYCKVMEIKHKFFKYAYRESDGDPYKYRPGMSCLSKWISKLDFREYKKFFRPLDVHQYGDLILIKYNLIRAQETDMWTNADSEYRETRSIVIDIRNDNIVLCPFRKFFNVDEVAENSVDNIMKEIEDADLVEISDKLDCSLQSAVWYNNKVILSGTSSLSNDESWRVADGYNKLTDNYVQMLKDYPHFTFCFENINVDDHKVVNYTEEQEGLYLIGIRDNTNGFQHPYSFCLQLAKKYGIKTTTIENKTFSQILRERSQYEACKKEGWVIYIRKDKNYHLIKLKTDDYLLLHRMIDKLESPKYVIEAIAANALDEMLMQAPDDYKRTIKGIAKQILDYIESMNNKVERMYIQAPKKDRKTFMIWVDKNIPDEFKVMVKCRYDGKEYNLLGTGPRRKEIMRKLGMKGVKKCLRSL